MEFCAGCGHRLGIGRFCTNCGRPIAPPAPDGDTAQRPDAHVPSSPPPAYTPPPAARYPLFSDELYAAPSTVGPPPVQPPPEYRRAAPRPPRTGTGPSFLAVALIVVILALVAVIGGLLLFSGDDDNTADDPTPAGGNDHSESSPPSSKPPKHTKGPIDAPPPTDGIQEIAAYAAATAPRTAKPNLDTSGNMVRYEATNMVDGVPATCWRTPGDGTGLELTFTFPDPVELSEVGLINGYAKSSGALDWYAGNRRVLAGTWIFDDGTEVPQSFTETRNLQSVSVGPITTSTVVLRLDSVSEPGRGPSARDNTAISDVSLVGAGA